MKNLVSTLVSLFLAVGSGIAVANDTVKVGSNDSVRTVLSKYVGKRVGLRMKDGGELTGLVRSIGSHTVHLGALRERDFFDAVVDLSEVNAVIIRVRDR